MLHHNLEMRYKSMHKTAKKDYPLSSPFSTIVTSYTLPPFNRSSNRLNRLFHAKAYTRSNESD